MEKVKVIKVADYWKASFVAMACPCDILMEVEDEAQAWQIAKIVSQEAWRIEQKFSRYLKGNIIDQINNANGKPLLLDDETVNLFKFADNLFNLSDGLFDISSGILRQLWHFDGSDKLPEKKAIKKLLKKIGWQKVKFTENTLTVPAGMALDLGGIGKEYAVDCCVQLVRRVTKKSVLINFGGDLAVTYARANNAYWAVGLIVTGKENSVGIFQQYRGAIATSGDKNRFLLKRGVRYSHILNPKTGMAVTDAPHTISVAAPTCIEAGMLSTLAILYGEKAEAFLKLQDVEYWLG